MAESVGREAQVSASDQPSSGCALEPFLALAKTAKGKAAQSLILQVLDAPNVYVFAELLQQDHVTELAKTEDGKPYFRALELFAYGTYKDYLAYKEELPELSTGMLNKLRRLSIVSLASGQKRIPYSILLEALDLANVRELEDLVIEAVYSNLIRGKLDQRKQVLVVDYCMGRDVKPSYVASMEKALQNWASTSHCLLLSLNEQMQKADVRKAKNLEHKKQLEDNYQNIRKNIKTASGNSSQSGVEVDLVIPPDVGSSDDKKKEKRSTKQAGLRGSAPKVWKNN